MHVQRSLAQRFLVHVPRERLNVLNRRRRKNPVTQVEDMTYSAARTLEHVVGGGDDPIEWTKQHRWIQVALNAAVESDALPRFVKRRAPVCADHVAPRGTQLAENRPGTDPEMD